MNIIISNANNVPIYEQIYSCLKSAIIMQELKTEDALPSIRTLAKDLRISVITTKRAYDELEKDGFIYSVPGKGFFVAQKNTEFIRESNLKEIEEHMHAIARAAPACGLTTEDIFEMYKLIEQCN